MDDKGAKKRVPKPIDRKGLCVVVRGMADEGMPSRGSFPVAASLCDVSRQTARRIFEEIQSTVKNCDNEHGTDCSNNPAMALDELFNNEAANPHVASAHGAVWQPALQRSPMGSLSDLSSFQSLRLLH